MRRCLSTDVNVMVDDDNVTFTRNGLKITSGTYAGARRRPSPLLYCTTPILVPPRVRMQNSRKQRNSMRSLLNV